MVSYSYRLPKGSPTRTYDFHTHTHTKRHQRNRCLFYYCKYNRWSAKHWLVINSITATITCSSFFLTGTEPPKGSETCGRVDDANLFKIIRWGSARQRKPQQPQWPKQPTPRDDELEAPISFLFDLSINALFERCSTTIDPSDRRGTFDHFGKSTFNIDLSMTNSNCYSATDNKPEGKRQIFSQKLLLDIANNSFQNDWWFPKWSTIDTLGQHITTSMIQLQASCKQRKNNNLPGAD